MTNQRKTVDIDLSGIEMKEIQLFVQEGTREIPAIATSSILPPCVTPCGNPPCVACAGSTATRPTSAAR